MHYHCEIVMPQTSDLEGSIARIMEPYSEHRDRDEEDGGRDYSFWDWYVVGGRWSGAKALAGLEVDPFWDWLRAEGITVSSLTAGKQTLRPASQVAKVDDKWREMFPDSPFIKCPLFDHSGDTLPGDVMALGSVHKSATASRVIVAGPSFDHELHGWYGPVKALFMLSEDYWNGLNHMKTAWDGLLLSAVDAFSKTLEHCKEEYVKAVSVTPDHLVVTVDYHS